MPTTLFHASSLRLLALDNGLLELCFDREGEAINKLDRRTVKQLGEALRLAAAQAGARGLLITSAKDVFIVGADITELGALFQCPETEIAAWTLQQNRAFNALEDLPMPTVVAINGYALGGGLETALAADFRVMAATAQIGLPEVKLGLIPGYGGTVRLPRVAGAALAIDWITDGAPRAAQTARDGGVVDAVARPEQLRALALDLLQTVAADADWRARRAGKQGPLALSAEEAQRLFASARETLARQAAPQQPAPAAVVELLAAAAALPRDAALNLEAQTFARIARTQAASSLVRVFLNEQQLRKRYRGQQARAPRQAAVLGAGIMGGGIAYTSALRGTPAILKDIRQQPLDQGLAEARRLLARQVESGRLTAAASEAVLASIRPQLDYAGFESMDLVVEAVVENLSVKHALLRELEPRLAPQAVIASNTSSLRIDDLAAPLQRPQNFVGMHFFNPVPAMPLVEVIRGRHSSDAATAAVVGYALAMGKTPVVVRDCPGFLVNRILTAYMLAFSRLVAEGANFAVVDRAMEAFGWPMGPAWLNDVIGLDTAVHVTQIIAAGYPQRMQGDWGLAPECLLRAGRLGQKNGSGFYRYEADARGRLQRRPDEHTAGLLAAMQPHGRRDFGEQDIVERMMLPMIVEAAIALEEGVVATPAELDMALLLGIGLPRHLGGILQYADWLGLASVVAASERLAALGAMYGVPDSLRERAARGRRYHD